MTFAYDYCTNEQKVLMSCVLLLVYKQLYFVSTTSTYYCYYCVFQAFLTILFSNISYSPTFQHPNVLHPSSLILHFLSFIYIWLWVWTSLLQVGINATRTHNNNLAFSIVRERDCYMYVGHCNVVDVIAGLYLG